MNKLNLTYSGPIIDGIDIHWVFEFIDFVFKSHSTLSSTSVIGSP